MYLDIFLAQVMEEMYGLGRTPLYSDETPPVDLPAYNQSFETFREQIPIFGSPTTDQMFCASSSSAVTDATSIKRRSSTGSEEEISNAIRAKIASHPLYPKLLQSYIDCQKVGAPSDIVDLFDEIPREKDFSMRSGAPSDIVDLFDEIPREKDFSMRFAASTYLGEDPELDEFMETYCEILNKYKSDLARPFDEATTFLKSIENQLRNLCNGATRTYISGAASNSEGDLGAGEIDVQESRQMREDRELKDKLFRKYSGYISSLKREFSNKKKKVKLPREARQVLLDWWAIHYMWPYPTEGDKVALAESAGLDQKQINNWFINQRKRHWKPSANMQFDVMESIDGQLLNE